MRLKDISLESNDKFTLPWGLRKRLEFIEFRLFWEERINRSDLISVFNISVPQASADISRYQEIAPENMIYDKKGKFYYSSPHFKPVLKTLTAEQYLLRYISIASGTVNPQKSFIGFVPPAGTVPIPWRRVEPEILKEVVQAIRYNRALIIEYQSMSRSEKLTRWISPHALGFDGFRWHCRAFCHIDNKFKDFILGRILNTGDVRDSDVEHIDDIEWETFVTVRIGPNSQLAENHRKIIEHEYGMIGGEASIEVRSAMLFYLLSKLGLSLDDEELSKKQYIVLLNKEELRSP